MDDLISVNKRVAIIRNDYKIVNVDLLRIDPELLKTQKNLIDEMYKPVTKTSEPLIHLVTGGEIYYDILVENNNNDEEDPQWIRILLVRGDFIIIPVGKTFRSTTTGTVST
jgi:cupin superfamily acireductone dioxygenase involved in methionine salvage